MNQGSGSSPCGSERKSKLLNAQREITLINSDADMSDARVKEHFSIRRRSALPRANTSRYS